MEIPRGVIVRLTKEGSRCHKARKDGNPIPLGTIGQVKAVRKIEDPMQYLVKFEGHGMPRHCEADEIEKII